MQKKTNNIKWKLLFCGCLLFLVLMVMVNIKDYRADKNRCVNILIESDEIANGCDIRNDIRGTEYNFIIDRADFTEYEIVEMEVK